jgi:hypothetical protein
MAMSKRRIINLNMVPPPIKDGEISYDVLSDRKLPALAVD